MCIQEAKGRVAGATHLTDVQVQLLQLGPPRGCGRRSGRHAGLVASGDGVTRVCGPGPHSGGQPLTQGPVCQTPGRSGRCGSVHRADSSTHPWPGGAAAAVAAGRFREKTRTVGSGTAPPVAGSAFSTLPGSAPPADSRSVASMRFVTSSSTGVGATGDSEDGRASSCGRRQLSRACAGRPRWKKLAMSPGRLCDIVARQPPPPCVSARRPRLQGRPRWQCARPRRLCAARRSGGSGWCAPSARRSWPEWQRPTRCVVVSELQQLCPCSRFLPLASPRDTCRPPVEGRRPQCGGWP